MVRLAAVMHSEKASVEERPSVRSLSRRTTLKLNKGSLVDESLGLYAVSGESRLMRIPLDPLKRAT
jgi:hypothetical protein